MMILVVNHLFFSLEYMHLQIIMEGGGGDGRGRRKMKGGTVKQKRV